MYTLNMSELQVPPVASAMDNPDSKSGVANGTPTEANDISMTDAPAQAIVRFSSAVLTQRCGATSRTEKNSGCRI